MRNLRLQLAAALALTAAAIITAPVFGGTIQQPGAAIDPVTTAAMDMPVKAGDLELSGMWIRAMLPGQPTGGGFLTITNAGSEDDRLVAVSTDAAGKAEVHEMTVVDGVMKMRPLSDGLAIPAGGTVELKPGSYHLMFMKVSEPFRQGTTVTVTLTFERAGEVELDLPVRPADAKAAGHKHGG